MTLPSEYNKISMGDVRTELNKSSGQISLNDDDVRILFQVSRTSGTIITLHNGHGKSNIMPPVVTKPPLLVDPLTLITQTSVTVTWKAYENLVIDGQVDNYQVQVYSVPDEVLRWDSGNLPKTASTVDVSGLVASAVHLVPNYRVDVMAKNISATKTSPLDLLTLENIPEKPSLPVATVLSNTQIRVNATSTYATTFYIYKDGASIPITTSSMPYTDTVGVYTSHTYTVKGNSTGGDGPMSDTSVSVRSLPDAPLAVVFTPYSSTNTTLTINWTLSTSPVVNYYKLVVVNFGTTTEVYRKNDVSNTTTSITISTNLAATSRYTATVETVNESSIFYNIPVSISNNVWTKTNAVSGTPVVTKLADPLLGQTRLQVSWNSVIGATGYKLVRTRIFGGVAQTPITFTVTPIVTDTLTFIDGDPATSPSELLSYTLYRYNVVAVNDGGDSALSTISADVRTLPGPPQVVTNLQVTPSNITNTTAKATWTDDTGQVNSYTAILKQGTTTIDTKANIAQGTQNVTFGSPTALVQNTVYSVTVTTYNDNTPPATTNAVSFTTKLNQPSSAPSVALNPDAVLGRTHLTVTFSAITGATSYKLVRFRISDSVEYVISPVAYIGTTTLTCDDSGLNSYEQYKYQLIAVNDGGDSVRSGYSNTVRTYPGPADASTLVVTIGTIAATTTSVSWAWSGSSGQVTSYQVFLSDSSNGAVYNTNTGTSLSVTLGQSPLAALSVNRAYSVVIKVINENPDISKAFTTAKGFVTTTTKPAAPTVDAAASTTQLVVNWTNNSATTYDLTRYNMTAGTSVSLTNKTTPFTDTGLLAYNEYQYTVTSNNSASTPIGVTSDRSPSGVRTLPNNPVAVSSISVTNKVAGAANTSARVNWANNDWAFSNGVVTKYDVSVKSSGGTEYGNANVSGTTTYLDVTVPCGDTYTIVIKTYNIVTYATSSGVNQFITPPVKPSAPYLDTGVTPNPTQTTISLKWTAVATANSYTLSPFKSDGTALTVVSGIGTNSIDWTVAVQKTSYYFKISASSSGGGSSVVSDNSSTILTLADKAGIPGKPVASVTGTDSITVSWTAPVGGNTPDSYRVYRNTPSRVDLGTKASGFSDTGLSANTSYTYTVQSYTTGGYSNESTASDAVTTWMVAPGQIVWSNPAITNKTTTSLTLNWSAPTTGGGVTRYIAQASGPDIRYSGDLAASTTSYRFENLTPWYYYYCYVTAYNTNPNGTISESRLDYTLPRAPNKPSTPTTSGVTYNSITISCAVSEPDGGIMTYVMYRNGTAASNAISSGSVTTYNNTSGTVTVTDTTVSANTAYVYYVQIQNMTDYSPMSDGSTSVTTPSQPPGNASGVTISSATTTSFTASWNAPTTGGAATSYKVVVKITGGALNSNVFTATPNTTSVSVNSGLVANTLYEVYVTASNAGGDSPSAAYSPAITLPPAVTIGTSSAITGGMRVNWSAPSGTGVAVSSYYVYRNGTTNLLTTSASGTYYDDTTTAAETSYSYYVRANNTTTISGVTYGGLGDYSSASVSKHTFPAAPAAPSITFAAGTGTGVTVTISSTNATSYVYSYGTTVPTSAATADADGVVAIANGTLLSATRYYFVATATRTANNLSSTSALSTSYSYDVPSTAKPAPNSIPTITSVTAGDQSFTVTFTVPASTTGPVEGAAVSSGGLWGYGASATWKTAIAGSGTGSITVTGLTNGTEYIITVHTYNSDAANPYTSYGTAVTPTAPAGFTPVSTSGAITASNPSFTYAFPATTARTTVFECWGSGDGSMPSGKVDTFLSITDGAGNSWSDDDGGASVHPRGSKLSITTVAGRTYTCTVTAYSPPPVSFTTTGIIAFTIS